MLKDLKALSHDLEHGTESEIWTAAADLSEYAIDHPEKAWPLVVRIGSSDNDEARRAIGTCVLEDILGHHFDEYFPLVEAEGAKGNLKFVDTLRMCWTIGESKEPSNARRWREFLSRYTTAVP